MLTKEEQEFITYWERNRLQRKKIVRQFLLGIPIGLLFAIPIVISLTSGWYRRANMEANSSDFDPRVLFVALLLIVGFIAVFYQRHKWDQYEQHYRELLAREARNAAPKLAEDSPGTQTTATAAEKALAEGSPGQHSPSQDLPDPQIPAPITDPTDTAATPTDTAATPDESPAE